MHFGAFSVRSVNKRWDMQPISVQTAAPPQAVVKRRNGPLKQRNKLYTKTATNTSEHIEVIYLNAHTHWPCSAANVPAYHG